MMIRMRTVRRKIDRPQAQPLSAGKIRLRPAWIWTITQATAPNSGSRKLRFTDGLLVLSDCGAALARREVVGVAGVVALARWYGVVPTRVERVAAGDAPHREPAALQGAVRAERLQG